MDAKDEIFAGNFLITTDVYLLQVARDSPHSGEFPGFVDVNPAASLAVRLDDSFDHVDVRYWAMLGVATGGGADEMPSLRIKNMVLRSDIAVRAFEISILEDSGSAENNWQRADYLLLHTDEAAPVASVPDSLLE